MNADEIVKALERMAPQFQAPGKEVINGATDLIESLQAQLADYHHMSELVDGKMEENQRLRRINENLQSKLTASQRRADAAVELIGKVSQAVEVAFNATDYVKPNTGIWHTLGLALDWIKAWRGPQEAGEGEQ